MAPKGLDSIGRERSRTMEEERTSRKRERERKKGISEWGKKKKTTE